MKVSDLIEKLKKLPQDKEVVREHWTMGAGSGVAYDEDIVIELVNIQDKDKVVIS